MNMSMGVCLYCLDRCGKTQPGKTNTVGGTASRLWPLSVYGGAEDHKRVFMRPFSLSVLDGGSD